MLSPRLRRRPLTDQTTWAGVPVVPWARPAETDMLSQIMLGRLNLFKQNTSLLCRNLAVGDFCKSCLEHPRHTQGGSPGRAPTGQAWTTPAWYAWIQATSGHARPGWAMSWTPLICRPCRALGQVSLSSLTGCIWEAIRRWSMVHQLQQHCIARHCTILHPHLT